MSKWNKAQKAEIAARVQRDAVKRRRLLAANIKVVTILQKVNDGQTGLIAQLRAEIDRLKGIDAALSDFNRKKQREQQDDLAHEGFEQVIASRQPARR